MAYNISDLVESVQLIFFRKNSCHGFLKFKDRENIYLLNFTGTSEPDLRGRRIHVEPNPAIAVDPPRPDLAKKFHMQQNGVTGTMTASRWVRYHHCPPAELIRRAATGELPPYEWKRSIYLEWFSVNGRVIIELIDPLITFWVSGENRSETDDNEIWEPLAAPPNKPTTTDLPVNLSDQEDNYNSVIGPRLYPSVESLDAPDDESFSLDEMPFAETEDHGDPHAQSLDSYLENISRVTDLSAGLSPHQSSDPDDPLIRQLDYMEEIIAGKHDSDDLLITILPNRAELERLNEQETELQMKVILAHLAHYQIMFHCCDHYSPRDLLHLIYDKYAHEIRVHPGMAGSGWTMNYDTGEHCQICIAESEASWKSFNENYRDDAQFLGDSPD